MTKEELKQEAEEYVCKRNPLVTKEWFIDAFKKYDKGEKVKYLKDCEIAEYEAYLASAEPREKRIAELEHQLTHRNCLDCSNHSSKLRMRTLELEEENAELKEKLKTAYRKGMRHMAKALKDYDRTDGAWTDYFEHTVDKVLQREQLDFEKYGTLADQFTKAKEIIREFVEWANWQGSKCPSFKSIQDKAEQFLNSEVEK